MAIRVKHDPSAAALGESAYTIGKGQRRERDVRLVADFYLRQQALGLQAKGLELQAERSAEQLALRADELEFRKEQDLAGRETAERRWEEEPSRQLQMGLQQQELLRKNISYQYDEGQKRELDKITTGVAWVRAQVAAGKWTAEQGEQAEQQLWQKYYSVIPLPVYDDTATPQERFDSGMVTDRTTGAKYREKANGDWEPVGIGFKDYSKLYADIFKILDSRMDKEGNRIPVDPLELDKQVLDAITRFSQIEGLATKVEEEQKRRAERGPQPTLEQEAKTKAAVEALPTLFNTLIKGQPRIGRKKKGETSRDKVYGEEAYNKTLMEAVGRGEQEGIPPDVMKAELDKWWDTQYDKQRGQMFQKFSNRMEFKGAARGIVSRKAAPEPQSQEEFIRTIQSMDDKTKAKAYYDKWVGKWQ